jgi:hypothetical protein
MYRLPQTEETKQQCKSKYTQSELVTSTLSNQRVSISPSEIYSFRYISFTFRFISVPYWMMLPSATITQHQGQITEEVWSIGGMTLTEGNWTSRREICSSVTLSYTNPTRTGLGSSLSLCSDRSVTGHLNHGTAPFILINVTADTYLMVHKLSINSIPEQWRKCIRILYQIVTAHFLHIYCIHINL